MLIPDRVQQRDVIGIAVRDEAQAKREVARLLLLGRHSPAIVIVPEFFDPNSLSRLLRAGNKPAEREHQRGATDVR